MIPLIHIITVTASFVILTLAFGSSLAYLVQDRLLTQKKPSKQLPALTTLDHLINRLVILGFVLLCISIVFGGLWLHANEGKWWSWRPRNILALVTWLVYAAYIYSRTLSGWKGKRSIMLIVAGFILIFVTFIISILR